MSRPSSVYDLVTRLFPLSKIAFKLGSQPIVGPMLRPLFSTRAHQAMILPVNEVIRVSESAVLPYALLEPLVRQASHRFIMAACMCRRSEDCHSYPQEIGCLYLGDGARHINPALGHQVDIEAALEHIRNGMGKGLVPLIAHTTFDAYLLGIPFRRMLTICFCCDCCCAIRHGLRMGPSAFWDVVVRLPGLQVAVSEECIGCEACLPSCQVQAITMNAGRASIDENCKGCGKCVNECPVNAISMQVDQGINMLDNLMASLQQRTDIGK